MADVVRLHRIAIHDGPLPAEWLSAHDLITADRGAVASFLGVVRNHGQGRGVRALHYQCYRSMAEDILVDLIRETAERFDPQLRACVIHGTGDMVPGDVALAIHAASAHRDAAFSACRYLIERIKQDLPVWKRQTYMDGSGEWLRGS